MLSIRDIAAIIGIVCAFALFCASLGLFVFVALFWFRADWFQVLILFVSGLSAFASWNVLGMVASWGSK